VFQNKTFLSGFYVFEGIYLWVVERFSDQSFVNEG